ncbi:MAG: type II toxin-antitoxin system VapC family toxin [Bacteroidales bacterium]|jgi:predicted nucleic acid-binding protein|nr:type II toxin-antitoxin system VapC family toxin [Paludibacter sp.]MDD4428839.1 type II toxin-antitoxin system VapC family toxin [Paludibacter sp.]
MNGNQLFIDTNIILYYLNGDTTLLPVLEDKQLFISFITQLELLSFKDITQPEIKMIESFLKECTIIEMSSMVKENTILLRRKYGLKLPDAIIAGSSLYLHVPLFTADKGLAKIKEIDLIYYQFTDI